MSQQAVIIIGAPRSGTNMLRDILCRFEGVATWPCDEINYIWRYNNADYASDEIPSDLASSKVKKYILNKFDWVAKTYNAHTVIEKTCANSLRVPFVSQVVPDAKYIFIYRDGLDVVGSAKLRWKAKLDIPYILKKVRFVPLLDIPYYALRYFGNHIYRFFSKEKRLAFWGPVFADTQHYLENYSLDEVCAIQWQRCVESTSKALEKISSENVIRVKYEDFVYAPVENTTRLLDFLKLEICKDSIEKKVSGVSNKNVGKGRASLSNEDIARLDALIGGTLRKYGY